LGAGRGYGARIASAFGLNDRPNESRIQPLPHRRILDDIVKGLSPVVSC